MSTRYHTLDHWRGVACLLVVVSHSTAPSTWRDTIGFFPPLGKVGVGIFFAISGYCIAAAVDSSRKREHGFGTFMFRRFRRIFPPYWAALLMTFSWKLAVYGPTSVRLSAWDYFGNLTLTETWLRIVNGDPNVDLLLEQAWTLCHEEQFYLICGLLLLAPARFFLPAIIAFCGLTLGVFVANRLDYINLGGTVLAGTWLSFASGVFVFYALHGARWERAASLAGIAIAVLASYSVWQESEGIATGCFFSGMLLLLYRLDAAIAGMACLRWLHWCGVISYSLYLTHLLVCANGHKWLRENGLESPFERLLIVVPICVTGSLLLAWPFHFFVERRFMPAPKSANSKEEEDGEHERQTENASRQTVVS